MNVRRDESYLVRIWQDGGVWRAKVTHVGSGKHRFFTSLGQLCLFWQEETAVGFPKQDSIKGDAANDS